MSKLRCKHPFMPCTQYPTCSRTCLNTRSDLKFCETSVDQYNDDCTCGVPSRISTDLIETYFRHLFACVEGACGQSVERGEFLRAYKEECLFRTEEIISDELIPEVFANVRLGNSTSTSESEPGTNATPIPGISLPPSITISPSETGQKEVPENSTNLPTPTSTTPPSNSSKDLSNGALAGISVGAAVVGIVIAGIAAVIAWKQYKFMKKQREEVSHGAAATDTRYFWQNSAVEMEG